ncbi:MAG: DUF981 family protein [Thermoproteota archaeon]|jgi:uncharacterized membrane protein|nr:DUF981 family protein [Thermoproteota archaeon]
MAVPPHDTLDSMAWVVGAAGILLALLFWRLPYDASKDTFQDTTKAKSFAIAFGLLGLYLLINGLLIIIIWPFGNIGGGVYDVLYGGSSAIGGILLLGIAFSLYLNTGLRAISYFAFIAALYSFNDVFAILANRLSRTPELAAFAYLMFGLTAILSVPLTHINNKATRWAFIIVALIFGITWLFMASTFTIGHLQAPVK